MSKINFMKKIPVPFRRIVIFILVVFTWIFFRAENASDAFLIIERIFTTDFSMPSMPLTMAVMILCCYLYEWMLEYGMASHFQKPLVRTAAMAAMIIYMLFFVTYTTNEFIYFQF